MSFFFGSLSYSFFAWLGEIGYPGHGSLGTLRGTGQGVWCGHAFLDWCVINLPGMILVHEILSL